MDDGAGGHAASIPGIAVRPFSREQAVYVDCSEACGVAAGFPVAFHLDHDWGGCLDLDCGFPV